MPWSTFVTLNTSHFHTVIVFTSFMTATGASRFLCLPEELLIHIFRFIDLLSLLTCRGVCKPFLQLIDNTLEFQYDIELYADGMEDGRGCSMGIAQRVAALRSRREAWRDLKPQLCTFPNNSSLWNAYELVDGVFAQTLNLPSANSSVGIQFASLPSRFSRGSLIQHRNVGFTFRDFAMDPTQNLIIYMACDDLNNSRGTHVVLHIRTITGNRIHPHARASELSMTSGVISGAVLQIADDVVGFMSWSNQESKLFIWDWKEGKQLVREPSLCSLDDFTFISPRAYVLTTPGRDASFRIFSFSESGAMLHATLKLPETLDHGFVALMGIHTAPFTTSNVPPPSIRPPRPFITSPQARVHVINLDFVHGPDLDEHRVQCLVVLHNRTFLSFIHGNKTIPITVPWSEWGRENTYWIPGMTGSQWLRYVHGERLVRLHRLNSGSGNEIISEIQIYDFGALRGPGKFMSDEERQEVKYLPTQELTIPTVFSEPLHFSLPCRIIRRREPRPSLGFMIDEDRLIGIKRFDLETNLDVYVL